MVPNKKFLSVFTKPYGQKILMQTAIGATLSGIVNFVRKRTGANVNINLSFQFQWYPYVRYFRGE